MWRVLHVTDFHIADPNDSHEHLRVDYYREYIDALAERAFATDSVPLDCIVATGDYVHQGKSDNFGHATTVLSYLAKAFRVELHNVVVCIGNHDIVRSFEVLHQYNDARKAYVDFSSHFANSTARRVHDKALLCDLGCDIVCMVLDTTLGSPDGLPGTVSDREIDEIVRCVQDLPKNKLLVIGTHYPPLFPAETFADQLDGDPDYYKKHLWQSGKPLRKRIVDIRRRQGEPTVWLCGDIHEPQHLRCAAVQYFVTTGRLGTSTPLSDSSVMRQAKVIQVRRKDGDAHVSTWTFEPLGHRESQHVGEWKNATSEMRPAEVSVVSSGVNDKDAEEESSGAGSVLCEAARSPRPQATPISLIDNGELQERVLEVIRDRKLYTIGRFHTVDREISLGWVSMGPLLNEPGVLSSIIEKMAVWLLNQATTLGFPPDKFILIGVDCWGAILASQLSVITGYTNFCIAARGRGAFSTPHEVVSATVCERVKNAWVVILVHDVVSTGSSLRWVYEQVMSGVGDYADRLHWMCISIICDRKQVRTVDCTFLRQFATACGDLRMPVLGHDALPDEAILPPRLSFTL